MQHLPDFWIGIDTGSALYMKVYTLYRSGKLGTVRAIPDMFIYGVPINRLVRLCRIIEEKSLNLIT
jgi:hypothetical protein